MIKLGDRVKDRMTGFSGIAIAITEFIYGCKRITIQPEKLHEGNVVDSMSFDEPQLEVISKKNFLASTPRTETPGGPRPEPQRRTTPSRL